MFLQYYNIIVAGSYYSLWQVNKVVEGDGREEACKQEMGFRGTGLAG